ncbi:universal stress protein [Desulfoscipio gibsoniae]|uniref:Universal stress protein n=1 Tax=Desulfoscipio gibsoniae DSM 7213 TaxID=767817 RepID=R4KED9_9FIRM|nr:universal stress protein [Desulfoscipio gibsoniae]AGL01533.1 universal stress protein UspA-like protein [Desulfoscipio gibsoniae DSM 7213]
MYKKILVPLDGSHPSMTAAEHAIQIAASFDAQVTFLHVAPNLIHYVTDPRLHAVFDYNQLKQEFTAQGETILEDARKEFEKHGVNIDKKLLWGHPSQEIIEECKEGQYDLLVMGSRGLGDIKGYLMGSVSNRVTRHAPCPVLIVR